MLYEDSGGWIGTKPMVKMPKQPAGILVSPKVSSTGGRGDTTDTISKHLKTTRGTDDLIMFEK